MFSFFKRQTKIIHTFNHVIGFQPEVLTEQEQDIVINTSEAIIKALKNKLMVVAIF